LYSITKPLKVNKYIISKSNVAVCNSLVRLDPLNDLMSSTCIPSKLQKMASLLYEEKTDVASSGCFQFIFDNRILEELAEFAKADVCKTT
jgi:hypothetical protein